MKRVLLCRASALLAVSVFPSAMAATEQTAACTAAPASQTSSDTVRDRLWLFGLPLRDLECKGEWQPTSRKMTVLEAACYLGIPNALFVVQRDFPEPPFDSYARALSPLKRVVWSLLGDSSSSRNDLDEVIRLSGKFPNIAGGIMDDFFHGRGDGRIARFGLDELEGLRDRLHGAPRKLDLWVVIYAHQLDWPTEEYLERCDAITFWTWYPDQLHQLEENFARLEAKAPSKTKLLGCYLEDFPGCGPMPVELMQHQCRLGLKWLEEGRIDGIIFLGNPVCGTGLEVVEWTRKWIAEVGERPLPPRGSGLPDSGRQEIPD